MMFISRRIATAAVVCAVAGFAVVVSYSHIYDLGRVHGHDGTSARLLPLSVRQADPGHVAGALYEAGNGRDAPHLVQVKLGSRDRLDPAIHVRVRSYLTDTTWQSVEYGTGPPGAFARWADITEFGLPVPSRGSLDEVPALRPYAGQVALVPAALR
jgi:hypothetical protein